MKETRNETNLKYRHVVVNIADMKHYLSNDEREIFWKLFWYIIDRKEAVEDGYSIVKEVKKDGISM